MQDPQNSSASIGPELGRRVCRKILTGAAVQGATKLGRLLETCAAAHAAGERPEAFNPCNCPPSQTIANASDPIPLDTGSTSVSVIAGATAASTALPPSASIDRPACAASGCDVHTTLRAKTGFLGQVYGRFQENAAVISAC